MILKIKKKTVTNNSQRRLTASNIPVLRPKIGSTPPTIVPRVMFTICVRGRMAIARPCAAVGSEVKGKNVPHKNSMGVIKRNEG